ncbi:MAG: hypothetical protein D6B26_05275 [Spirochaetaceae bacterium]|nr:MAG: hypothetical protein D6B26_05275 [Spirochaetaceae bacterium]
MPKELGHWIIAQETARLLGDASKLNVGEYPRTITHAIQQYPSWFILGSVCHDCGFYQRDDSYAHLRKMSDRLHGKGMEDSFASVKGLVSHYFADGQGGTSDGQGGVPDYVLAFAAGALSHIAADTVFHPMIFYYTGITGEDGGLHRHMAFESALDQYLQRKYTAPFRGKVKKAYAHAKGLVNEAAFLKCLGVFYSWDAPLPEHESWRLIRTHLRIQRLFSCLPLRLLGRLVYLPYRGSNKDLSSILYPLGRRPAKFFENQLEWRNPVTGEHFSASVESLFDQAVLRGKAWIEDLDAFLLADGTTDRGEKPAGEVASAVRAASERVTGGLACPFSENQSGPCLDMGVPAGSGEARFFRQPLVEICTSVRR